MALLRKWGGEQKETPPATAEAICQLVGRLPLAVRLAGRYLSQTGETPAEYLAWLRETPLDALNEGARREQSVRVLLDKSLDQVSARARQVLAVVGLLALAPFRRAPLAAALEASPNALRKPLGELMRYGLLTRDEAEYAVSHALVHTYARTCCVPESGAVARLAAYYFLLTDTERAKGLTGYRRLDDEREHIMRVLTSCVEHERWEAIQILVWVMDSYLDLQGYWAERQQALEKGIKAARTLNHLQDEEAFLIMMGMACQDLGQVEQAIEYYEQALDICREIGHRQDEGHALGNLGNAYYSLGQIDQAIEYHEQALAIQREIGHLRGQGNQLGGLGSAYFSLGQVKRAIEYYQQALAISRKICAATPEGSSEWIAARRGESGRLGNLGNAYAALGQMEADRNHPGAIKHYEQALEIQREIGDRRGQGKQLCNLGLAYAYLGQVKQSIQFYKQALKISREIGDRRSEAAALGNLGNVYADLGQVEADGEHPNAIQYHRQALEISREIGDRHGEGTDLGNLGNAYAALEQVERAIEYYEQALVIQRKIGDRRGQGNQLFNLGLAYTHLRQLKRARECLQQALAIFKEIKSPYAEQARGSLEQLDDQ